MRAITLAVGHVEFHRKIGNQKLLEFLFGTPDPAKKPRLWSPKPIVNLVNSVKNFDLAPDGKRIAALMPVETPEDSGVQSHLTFLLNFFDELERRVPIRK